MVAAIRDYDEDHMLERGLAVMRHHVVGEQQENLMNFKAAYGASPQTCVAIWRDMWDSDNAQITIGAESNLDHFFWALHFIRAYPLERNMAGHVGVSRRTLMKWVKDYVMRLSLLKEQKVRLCKFC